MTGANEMTTWPPGELASIGGSEELELASRRADGSLRPYVTSRQGNDQEPKEERLTEIRPMKTRALGGLKVSARRPHRMYQCGPSDLLSSEVMPYDKGESYGHDTCHQSDPRPESDPQPGYPPWAGVHSASAFDPEWCRRM